MQYLTQKELKKMILLSWQRVEGEKEEINKINVFPVPDQDTGSNLAKTLLGIKNAIENKKFKDLEEISNTALDGALTAAQGNAGVIYTGFLAGFLPTFQNKNPIDAKKLAKAMQEGAKRARQAIQNPKDGTILDVIDATRDSIEEESKNERDIPTLLKRAIEKAHEALLATREKMEVFRKANVVDAGGLGYLMILESYLEALEGEKKEKREEGRPSEKVRRFVQTISNRYEVISLIKNPKFDEKTIRGRLKNLGNCLDIVKVKDKMKIHIHTDYPDEVKEIMREAGKILTLREEDMAKEVVGEESVREISVGIVTDEIADLTQKITERYQIEVVPYKIDWKEGENLPGENIYQKMREAEKRDITKLPKTSQASPKEFLEVFKEQLKTFDKVLCIPLSFKVSGGYNSAMQARSMLDNPSKIYILDSLQATAGQALLILKAIGLIQEQRDIGEVIIELKTTIPKIHLYAFMADPKWLEWGGRLSPKLANWIRRFQRLHFYPFIGLKKGVVKPMGIARAKDLSEALFKLIEKNSKKMRKQGKKIRVVITHCDNQEGAKRLKKMLKERIKAEVSFVSLTGSVVGVHVGPGSLIAAWIAM